ncbi:AAA family ATPase [Streptomyces sp. 8L]|uniref:AAA family ATPase n=1 Tax=Streptomyces sp. 8L TaxID=2877242 RepID=UPI0035A97538
MSSLNPSISVSFGPFSDPSSARSVCARRTREEPLHERQGSCMIERESELAELAAAFDESAAGGVRVVVLQGVVGTGKTALIEEFGGRARGRGRDCSRRAGRRPSGRSPWASCVSCSLVTSSTATGRPSYAVCSTTSSSPTRCATG